VQILKVAPTMFFADYGCHVRILEEARTLRKRGHRVTILTYPNGRDIAGLDVRRGWGVPFNYRVYVGSSRHKIYLDALLAVKGVGTVLRDPPDIIHAHLHEGALIGYPLSRLKRVPLVFDFQGSLSAEMVDHRFLRRDGPFYSPVRYLERLIDHLPAVIVTSSHHAADLLVREFGCPASRIVPVPDSADTDTFRPRVPEDAGEIASLKERLGIPADRRVIAYLGLLATYQGTDLLLTAMPDVLRSAADAHLLLMGYPGEDHYRRMASELGLADRVTITGRIPYEEAPAYLRLGDIAVAPKVSATEGSGKLLNYMALALPTVAFDTPVSREYLGDSGVYAKAGDVAALAQALAAMLNDMAGARNLGRTLRVRAQAKFSWDRTIDTILDVYRLVSD